LPRFPDLRLAILGTGGGLPALRADVARRGLERIVILNDRWIDHSLVPDYLVAADLAVYPYRDTLVNRAKCSAKIIDYMAMRLPIVASRVGRTWNTSNMARAACSPSRAIPIRSTDDASRTGRSTPGQGMGQAARERVWARFDWDKLVETVEAAYQYARRK